MPFPKWTVHPVHLCRSADPEKKCSEFETVCNGSLVKGLRQLAAIARLADKIFDELTNECRLVIERTERLQLKVEFCRDAASKLNARAVRVPVSDLNTTFKFLRRQEPFKTVYDMPTQLFLPSNRPPCVDTMYNRATATPVSLICTIDKYRTDGRTSSELFMVTPVLGGVTRKKRRRMLDIEMRKPASFTLATQQESQELGISEDEVSVPRMVAAPSTSRETKSLDRLPSPEEQTMAISMEYPSTVVPVDTSGFSFLRMIRCRRSLIHADFVIKRKKDKHKSKRRHTVCEGSSKELETAVQSITMINSSCQTEELSEPGSFFSLRRSFCRRKSKHSDAARRETVALDGLDLDSLRKSNGSNVCASDDDKQTSKRDSINSHKKTGKASSLMSRAANFNPISSLSAALSMAVKLRHSKSGKQDDGRSSSGNWSASSSTRASMDSDHHHVNIMVDRTSNVSRNSAGKDSVISDATQQESVRSQELVLASDPVQSSRFSSIKPGCEKIHGQWDFESDRGRESNNSTPERSSDCASTPLVMSPYTARRHHNFGPPTAFDDGESSVYSVDTDGYYTSMHTDSGLWHNVLQHRKNSENHYGDSIRCRRRQESQSSVSTIGNSSINSFLSRTVTENSSNNGSLKRIPKPGPEPPPRTLTNYDSTETVKLAETAKEDEEHIEKQRYEKESSPLKNGSASESDHEAGDRIRVKTTINSSRYPSMCAVSPETSDDELSDIEKAKPPSVSIVVAEVHQEEKIDGSKQLASLNKNPSTPIHNFEPQKNKRAINMYGNCSPAQSPFEYGDLRTNQIATSTPKSANSVSSFSSDPDDADKRMHLKETPNVRRELLQNLEAATKNISSIGDDFIVTSPPISPKQVSRNVERTLIPLKYAQRITVTPIVRSESSENNSNQNSTPINSPTARTKSFLKNPLSNLPFLQAENSSSKSKSPSYVSFQSPDSPVSSSTSLSPADKLIPITRAVARVTLDPTGKVIYSSSSLDRIKREEDKSKTGDSNCNASPKYATLPKYQSPTAFHLQKPSSDAHVVPKTSVTHNTTPISPTVSSSFPDTSIPGQNTGSSVEKPQNLFFRPSRGGRFCRTYFPSHLISTQSKMLNKPSPPSPSASVKSTSSTSSQSSYGSKQPFEQQQYSSSTPSNTLQNRNFVQTSKMSPTVSRQFSYTPPVNNTRDNINEFHKPYSPYINNNSPTTIQYRTSPQHNINNQNTSVPPTPSSYQFRPMHFPQEMHATTSVYTSNPPLPNYGVLTSTPTATYSQLRSLQNSIYTKNEDRETDVIDRLPSADFALSNQPDVIPSSTTPPSTLDITSRTARKSLSSSFVDESSSNNNNNNLKSMSPKELFAIIHDSKKKHNIKTDSEKSLSPLSSRSNSPSVMLSPPPIKSQKIETGTFTKQTERLSRTPNITKSTAVHLSPDRSMVQDRLNRTKPTSMHDFKMLLLQTRVGTNESNSRPSAAELLKVSPPKQSPSSPQNSLHSKQPPSSPQNSLYSRQSSSSPQNVLCSRQSSPLTKVLHHQSGFGGHISVPVKRNARTRSPYLTRYDSAYPPIWEDCSEDLEEADENQNQLNYVSGSTTQTLTNSAVFSSNQDTSLDNSQSNPKAASTWV